VVQSLSGASDAKYTKYRYGAEGQTLRTENCAAMTDFTSRGSGHDCTGAYLDATSGTHAVYADASGSTASYDDVPSGGGSVSSPNGPGSGGARWLATTLYAVVDSTQSLPPRGNVTGLTTAQWQAFLTTTSVDNQASVAPNLRGASSVCSVPSTPVGNTGDVCQVVGPSYNGSSPTRSSMTYLPTGEVATRTTPNALGVHYTDVIVGDGPSDYWPLAEPAGATTAGNLIAPTRPLTPSNVTFGAGGPLPDGKTAAAVNGTNANLSGSTAGFASGSVTLEAWINPQVNSQAMTPIVKVGSCGWKCTGTAGLGVSGDATSLEFYDYSYLPPAGTGVLATGLHLAGAWHHVVGVSDGVNDTLYLDGQALGTAPAQLSTGCWCIVGSGVVAGGSAGSALWMKGSLAHVAVYRTALTATQVTAHLAAGAIDASRFTYKYYADADKDLSGTVVSGGWLKAAVDPSGNFDAYAYDAAGDRVRTWDRDSTAGHDVSLYPGTVSAPPTTTYSETLHGAGSTAYSAPGRYVVSERNQVGDVTTYTRDADGNATKVRPPRGTQANTPSYDVTQAFDASDEKVCTIQPVEANGAVCSAAGSRIAGATQVSYDARGNLTQVTDPVGNIVVSASDAANRKVRSTWIRGWNYSDSRSPYFGSSFPAPSPANCPVLSAVDGPFPAGAIECHSTTTYDGAGNVVATTDGDGGQVQRSYDPQSHVLSSSVERSASPLTWERTDNVYDQDGNVVRTCPPNSFANGTANCASSNSAYDKAATYDVNDRVATSTSCRASCQAPNVYTTTHTYDADGNETTVTDPRSVTTTSTFDLLDRKTSSTFSRGGVPVSTMWLYSYSGDVLDVVDPAGKVTATSYDAAHRKGDVVEAADDLAAGLAGSLSSDGGSNVRTSYSYGVGGLVSTILPPQAFKTISSPDYRFHLTKSYDADGRLVTTSEPRSDSADPAVNDPSSSGQCPTGAGGYLSTVAVCVTKYSYDADGRVSSTLLPTAAGNWSSPRHVDAAYTADGLKASTTSPSPTGSGTVRTYAFYDASGRTVKTLDGLGTPDTTAYSPDGLVTQHSAEPAQTLQSGAWVTTVWHCETMGYDASGNKITDARYLDLNQPASGCSNTPLTETWSYSSDNFPASDADAGGNVTSWTRDQLGNPIQVMSPSANAGDASNSGRTPTVNAYTEDNLLASTTVPVTPDGSQRRQTTFAYTPFGAKSSQTVNVVNATGGVVAAGGTQGYAYYPDERLQTTTGRSSEVITNQYDGAGRPKSIVYTAPGQNTSTVTASYYLNGLPLSVSETVASRTSAGYRYSYDAAGGLMYRYSAGYATHTATYAMGDAGQVTNASDVDLGNWSWNYDAGGRPTHQNNPNGTYTDFGWGSDNVLATEAPYDTGYLGNRCNWTYDSLYRLTFSGCTAAEPFTGSAFNTNDNYGYDNAGRITSYTHGMNSYSGGADLLTFAGTYDHNGNRLSWGSTTATVDSQRTATYNADDSIRTETIGITQARPGGLQTATYAYAPSGVVQYDGCRNLAYDGFDQMTSAAVAGGNQCGVTNATTFIYDGLHRQVGHTDGPYQLFTAVYHDALSNSLVLQQQQWLPNFNNRETYYALAPDGTALGDMFGAMYGGFQKSEYFAYDQHRNPIRVTASNGSVVSAPLIDPFGAALNDQLSGTSPQQRSTQASSVGFKGFEQDPGTATQHLGARDYRPLTGTFGQVDSFVDDPSGRSDARLAAGNVRGMQNPWGFANGDPVNHWDPSGHDVCRENPQDCVDDNGNPDQGLMNAQAVGTRGGTVQQVQQAQQYGQAHQAAAQQVRHEAHVDQARAVALTHLNAETGAGDYLPAGCRPLYEFDAKEGTLRSHHVYDGCDRNPGGVCHNPGGEMRLECTYSDAIPGDPAPANQTYKNEILNYKVCDADCISWLFILTPSGLTRGAEELGAKWAIDAIVEHVAEDVSAAAASKIATEAGTAGADLTLRYKAGWSALQRAEADAKVGLLNRAAEEGGLSAGPATPRGASGSRVWDSIVGTPRSAGYDVDHIIDLQLGGANAADNLWLLNSSVNRSLGSQIACKLAKLPTGAPITSVSIC
jgi:RHS repeat-associated protein